MRAITLASTDATERHTGHLPESWAEVGLAHYVALASAQTLPETCRALAELCGLPPAVLTSDASLAVQIKKAAPWLFDGTLPEAELLRTFTHGGMKYEHVGDLHKINAGQMEALSDFLGEHEAEPLKAGPKLLAVLYKRVGKKIEQTHEVVDAAAKAFETLPMSVAWPALQSFTRSGQASAAATNMYLVVAPKAEALLTTLEQTLAGTGASKSFFRKPLNWLIARWIRYVRKTLPAS